MSTFDAALQLIEAIGAEAFAQEVIRALSTDQLANICEYIARNREVEL